MSKQTKAIYITFNGITDPLGQSQVLPYLEGLSSSGVKFYLVSLEKNLKEAKKLSNHIADLGIIWYRLKYFRFYSLGMALNIIQCFLLVFYLTFFKKVKIIHARAYPPMFSVFLFKKVLKIKIIFDIRGFWPEELICSKRIKEGSIYYKMLKFLEKMSILSSDWVVTLTPESKEIIEEKFKIKNVVWMPTCVDENKFKNQEKVFFEGKFIIIYSGSLWSFYDMPSQIDFFNVLKTKITNSHFLILANNKPEKMYELLAQKGVNKEDYTVVSSKSEDVPKYLASSNLGLSFRYDFYCEKAAFPTKLAEYLISGLPVVINTQSDYIKKLINSNKIGVVLEAFNKNSYQEAVESLLILLKDGNLKERCRETARKYLGKNVCIDKYMDIYRELE
jgi:glycosyltransferase involved in cell wall biosynthesis